MLSASLRRYRRCGGRMSGAMLLERGVQAGLVVPSWGAVDRVLWAMIAVDGSWFFGYDDERDWLSRGLSAENKGRDAGREVEGPGMAY